jgi:hypothetical protein
VAQRGKKKESELSFVSNLPMNTKRCKSLEPFSEVGFYSYLLNNS